MGISNVHNFAYSSDTSLEYHIITALQSNNTIFFTLKRDSFSTWKAQVEEEFTYFVHYKVTA